MAYTTAADGITKQGRTKGKNLGDDGAKIGIETGPKSSGSKQMALQCVDMVQLLKVLNHAVQWRNK